MPRRIPILLVLTILWCARPLDAAPAISNVNCPTSAALYDKLEMTFNVTTVATNPYWPYDAAPAANTVAHPNAVSVGVGVSVDGLFLPPGETNWNNAIVQPGFYYQPYSPDPVNPNRIVGGRNWMYPEGAPEWMIRFAPQLRGTWKYKIRVRDASGEAFSSEALFSCTAGSSKGFVRVSSNDSRYFELSDGTYLPLIGISSSTANLAGFESEYTKLQSMGVNLIRSWWQSSAPPTALFGAGGQGGDLNWSNLVVSSDEVRPGHLVSAKMTNTAGGIKTVFATVPVKPGKAYTFSAWVKTVALTGTGDFGFGLAVFPCQSESGTTKVTGDTEWTQVSNSFTTKSDQYEVTWASLVLNGVTSGAAYITDVSMRANLGAGNYGPELLMRTDFQPHTGYSQQIAWTIDNQLETAAKHGVYVKAVIEEKGDSFFRRIQADGSLGTGSDDNVYASATHASRTYQSYYWRYLIARYGYSTALHSLEFVNEGDPTNPNHQGAVKALGAYFQANDPNKHLASTSNWHSFSPPMWGQPEVDIADLHMYMGWGVASGGNRLFAGWDGNWTVQNHATALGVGWELDTTEVYEGHQSLKVTVLPAEPRGADLYFYCGVIPGHTYKVSWMAKAENIWAPDNPNPVTPHLMTYFNPGIGWSYSENGGDYAGAPAAQGVGIPNGTYEWQLVETPEFTVPADTSTTRIRQLSVGLRSQYGQAVDHGTGYAWFDDFKVTDVTTGEVLNYNGGFEYMDSESYDVVAGHSAYSQLTHSFGFNKPTIRGEVGFTHALRFTDPYKGFAYTGEDQLLIDDTAGIWWKKWTWANIHPGGLTEIYWWNTLLLHPAYGGKYPKYGKAYQDFMADIPLSNGHYVDAGVTTSTGLRVLGQKDLTHNKAHLWIDNPKHTWKNVVDGVAIPAVSGTVTVNGLRDGPYKVEWWDTSTGVITSTDSLQCTAGRIRLVVSGLATDKACKIYQDDASPPSGSISINGGDASTTSTLVTLLLSAIDADSGVSMMRFSNDGSVWSNWETYSTSKAWNISEGDGERIVYVQYMNGGQTTSSLYYDSIVSDNTQPSGTIMINSGAASTVSTAVTLTLAATDATSGVAQMRFSNDGATWSTWESYGTSKSWTLPSGDGTKTVYVQYKDGAGKASQNCTDTIILANSGPTGAITINGGAEYVKTTSVTLTLSASGGVTSVTQMRFSNDGTTWGAWLTYAASKSWNLSSGDGTKTVYVQYKDETGRTSPNYTDTIIMDKSVPKVRIVFPKDPANYYSNHASLTVRGTADADVTSLSWATDSGDSGNCSGTSSWETEGIALTEGANVITVTAWDAAGNSITQSVTLHRVDVHPPDTWVSSMMVSIPLIPDEPDPKAALGFDSNAWCIFRPMQNNYVAYGDDSEHLTWLDPAAATLGRGFWARFLDPATPPLGEIPDQNQPATIHLYPGWNIIGTPFLSPVQWDVTQITVCEVGGVQQTLANSRSVLDDFAFGWRRIEGVGAYYIVYDSNIYPGIDSTLEPWMAYWVRVYRECDLTLPAPPSIP